MPVASDAVVGGAALGVLQHLVGLGHVLEARLGLDLLADVGVVLARKLAVGALDRGLVGGALDAEHGVVVLVVHAICTRRLRPL
jgi:hypothetical protein